MGFTVAEIIALVGGLTGLVTTIAQILRNRAINKKLDSENEQTTIQTMEIIKNTALSLIEPLQTENERIKTSLNAAVVRLESCEQEIQKCKRLKNTLMNLLRELHQGASRLSKQVESLGATPVFEISDIPTKFQDKE
jgi:transcriptional regulator of aromatic amino acid metabolism